MMSETTGTSSSLEFVKLGVQALTPLAVALLGVYLTRLAKRFEHQQWRNQKLIEKRLAVYDDLAPLLNDLFCYFTYVGSWKEPTPVQVVAIKRDLDKRFYLAAPLFSPEFRKAYQAFLHQCFATYQGWGRDARLRTKYERRREAAGAAWQQEWSACFAEDAAQPSEVRAAYSRLVRVFSEDLGIAGSLSEESGPETGRERVGVRDVESADVRADH